MDIDYSKIKSGDVVVATFRVALTRLHAATGPQLVMVEVEGNLIDLPVRYISGHAPKALEVGDQVKVDCHDGVFTIEGVSNHGHGPNYWCVRPLPNLKYVTAHHSVVDRLDQ